MSNIQRTLCRLLIALLIFPLAPRAHASAYDAHPKLVILLVIDQFRADYLDRYRADLKGKGFRLFLDHGAYFEDCYYDYANTRTAPGHATLGTGAYTDGHGISSNSWWDLDRNKEREIDVVEDERYHLVGLPNAKPPNVGASPLNLRASTLGDSLRLATQSRSRVFGISLKDRAAILLAGYSANGAYWIDPVTGLFITSSYYMYALPDWVNEFNTSGRIEQAEQEAGTTTTNQFYKIVGPTPAANSYELDFARALIGNEELGKHPVTDLLTISLSATDILGHKVGPDSPEERQMVDSLDQQLDSFFTWLDKNIPGGLANVWIALSADHGVAPVPAQAASLGMPAANINLGKFAASLNDTMNAKFSPGEKVEYLLPQQELPYLALNRPSFEGAGINEQEAEQAIQQAVPAAVAAIAPPPAESSGSASNEAEAATAAPGATGQTTAPAATESAPPPGAASNPAPTSSPATASPQAAAPSVGSKPGSKTNRKLASKSPKGKAAASAAAAAAAAAALAAPPPPPPVRMPPVPVVVQTYTRQQLASGEFPPTPWGSLLAHSYSANGGWYVMVIPAAFQMATLQEGTTHFSPWSYDRHVPLGFYGAPFTPGIYHGRVQPVDLAATLASLLGINQPSASVGNILVQAIHNVPAQPAQRGNLRSRRSSTDRSSAAQSSTAGERATQ